jgi:hypothetical protein
MVQLVLRGSDANCQAGAQGHLRGVTRGVAVQCRQGWQEVCAHVQAADRRR